MTQVRTTDAKIVHLIQGTNEWLTTRRKYITATEIGMITNPSRWKTYERQKQSDRNFQSRAMARGNRLEPVARDALAKRTGMTYYPAVFVSNSEKLLASLDGLTLGRKATCEIKCPEKGKESDLWCKVEAGKLPKSHWQQMQLGLLLSGAPACHYWVYDATSGEGLYKEILPDETYFMEILTQSQAYWKSKTISAIGASNTEIVNDSECLELAVNYQKVVNEIKYLEKKKESLAEKLESKFSEGTERLLIGNLQVDKKHGFGKIDYKAIVKGIAPHLDVEKYRKTPTKSDQVTVKIIEGIKAA